MRIIFGNHFSKHKTIIHVAIHLYARPCRRKYITHYSIVLPLRVFTIIQVIIIRTSYVVWTVYLHTRVHRMDETGKCVHAVCRTYTLSIIQISSHRGHQSYLWIGFCFLGEINIRPHRPFAEVLCRSRVVSQRCFRVFYRTLRQFSQMVHLKKSRSSWGCDHNNTLYYIGQRS